MPSPRTAKQERDAVIAWLEDHARWHHERAVERRKKGYTYAANHDASLAGLLGHHAEVIGLRLHHESTTRGGSDER